MSDNVPPHPSVQYWRQKKNPEYQWDPWKDDDTPWYSETTTAFSLIESHVTNAPDRFSPASSFGLARCENRPAPWVFSPHDLDRVAEETQDVDMTLGIELTSPTQPEPQGVTTILREQPVTFGPSYYAVALESSASPGNDGFEFESGCRPIGQTTDSGEQDPNGTATSDDRLKCEYPGCTSKRTFARKYELQRHMKKHTPPVSYPCPVLGCAYRGARAFYRADKLKVHLRMSHTDDALCQCPVQGCPNQQLTLALLVIHAGYHRSDLHAHHGLEVVQDYQKNHDTVAARCPIGDSKSCGKWLAKAKLPSHILSHSEEERAKFREDALQAGYDSLTGNPVCPICHEAFPNHDDFAKHIHLVHLVEPGSADAAHVAACYEALVGHQILGNQLQWVEMWELPYWRYNFKQEILVCPVCQAFLIGKDVWDFRGTNRDNFRGHLNIHKEDIADVVMHRAQILRNYPSLIDHPIFDDVRATGF